MKTVFKYQRLVAIKKKTNMTYSKSFITIRTFATHRKYILIKFKNIN